MSKDPIVAPLLFNLEGWEEQLIMQTTKIKFKSNAKELEKLAKSKNMFLRTRIKPIEKNIKFFT